ncbi:type II toxin-antitoxin system RelE/ParE family toxin [Mucilaginibacter ximonensis]|uniref:Type II toxin-antitoxin system RelE/ParE family toxin n=1 Tax=Mucilaginibacter ximonensis TaxID=538021 RepID=A0ABW5YDQ9_9SPHI
MAKDVVLTPLAAEDFYNVLNYLTNKWGDEVVNDFLDRYEDVIALLADSAAIYPYFDIARKLQRCVLTKHNILYFRETEDSVLIFTIFDTRQNPEKLSGII